MTQVLTLASYYLPGWKAGGSLRSIANCIEHLGDEVSFKVVTRDRDIGDGAPYPGLDDIEWTAVGRAHVIYVPPAGQYARVQRIATETPHDVLYLNSLFDPVFSLWPLLLRRLNRARTSRVVIAPRGECAVHAMRAKAWKKRPVLALVRLIGLFGGVVWQASSEHEAADIRRVIGRRARIVIAPDLPTPRRAMGIAGRKNRPPAAPLRICFLSRISPIKNLEFAIEVLAGVDVDATLNIFGPIEDPGYWRKCERLIEEHRISGRVRYCGAVGSAEVHQVLSEHDLLLLPSRGENFGHVIIEALSVGTPVLISDRTPWRGLKDKGLGWDLPLEDKSAFTAAIRDAATLSEDRYASWCARIAAFAAQMNAEGDALAANRSLFQ